MDDIDRKIFSEWLAKNAAKLDDEAAAALANTPALIDNPEPQGQVPAYFYGTTLTLAVDETRRHNLRPYIGDLAPHIVAQSRPMIAGWAAELVLLGELEQSDADAIQAVLDTTMPDPTWQKTVIGPSPWRAMFGDREFVEKQGEQEYRFSGHCTSAMVAETRGG